MLIPMFAIILKIANVATRSVMNLAKCFASVPSASVVAPARLAHIATLRRTTLAPSALLVSSELRASIHLTCACLVQLGNIMAMMTRMQASSLFGDFDMFGWAETPEEENDREIANLEASMEATRRKLRSAAAR